MQGADPPAVGRLAFDGAQFRVEYVDGSSEVLSNRAVAKRQHWLLPEGAPVPAQLRGAQYESPSWQAVTTAAACTVQPALPSLVVQPGTAVFERTLQADAVVLLRQLNLESARVMVEVFPHSQTLSRTFQALGHTLAPAGGDGLAVLEPADVVISGAPSEDVISFSPGLLAALAMQLCAIRLPLSWLSGPASPASRLDAGGAVVAVLQASKQGPEVWAWLVIARNPRLLSAVSGAAIC